MYTHDNAQIVNGALVITAKKLSDTYFTSSRLRTYGLQPFHPNASYPNGIRISASMLLPEGELP